MIRSVMLALSGSPYTPTATRYAIELAARHGSQVTGVSFMDVERLYRQPVPVGAIGFARRAADEAVAVARKRVAYAKVAMIEAADAAGIGHRIVERDGDPIEHLIEEWRYHDLTVFGLKGLFEYRIIPEPEHVLARLVSVGVRPILAVAQDWRPIRRVVVASSGSLSSSKVLKRWLQMRLWPEAELHLVHFGRRDASMEDHLRRTADFCQLHQAPVASRRQVEGHPRCDLLPYAHQVGGDLIVMGDSARSLLSRALFGDTALHLVKHADLPLFLSH